MGRDRFVPFLDSESSRYGDQSPEEGPQPAAKKNRRASCKGCIETGLARIEADTAEV